MPLEFTCNLVYVPAVTPDAFRVSGIATEPLQFRVAEPVASPVVLIVWLLTTKLKAFVVELYVGVIPTWVPSVIDSAASSLM
ncbi:hypothetical protein D3C75_1244990 [compost metagenome]